MYHATRADRRANAVELVPVEETGLYPGMPDIDGPPPFAHVAIYPNAMMIYQRFYRWYQSSSTANFDVRIGEFLAWLASITTLLFSRRRFISIGQRCCNASAFCET
jgi:hypothetical protein